MKFYCIVDPSKNHSTIRALKVSCEARGVDFILIDPHTFDVTSFKKSDEYSLLYRVSTGDVAREVERHVINMSRFVTMYSSEDRVFFNASDTSLQKHKNIRIPKTINYLPKDGELLVKYAEYVGGFPLIVKTNGLSHGVGVRKVESIDELISLADTVSNNSIIRQFIPHDGHARLMVLGSKVISSIEYIKPEDDFRTNVGEPNVRPKVYSSEIEEEAVKVTADMGLEFAGVDILTGTDDTYYVAEVNFPCFFMRAQDATGVDISGQMIDFLIKKAQAKSNT